MKLMYLILSVLVYKAYSNDCNLKPSSIDWKKLKGTTWYTVMQSMHDSLDKVSPCFSLRLKSGGKILFFTIPVEHPNDTTVSRQRYRKYKDGYLLEKVRESDWDHKLEKEAAKRHPQELSNVSKALHVNFKYPTYLYTDYETYFLGIVCYPDSQYIHVALDTNKLDPEKILAVHNVLAENNFIAPLQPSKCLDISNLDYYLKNK